MPLLCIAVLLPLAGQAQAAYPGANGRIAYSRNGALWTMNPDGGGQGELVPASVATSPAWSPDDTRIAIDGIDVMNRDGTGRMRLSAGYGPAWSPDATRIAFGTDPAIAVTHIYGGPVTYITDGGGYLDYSYDQEPAWSPDGSRIAFTRVVYPPRGSPYSDIYVVNADGSGEALFPGLPGEDDFDVDWSPDGTKIAFSHAGHVWTASSDGSQATDLTPVDGGYDPVWSPDGTRIAFTRVTGTSCSGSCTDIFSMNADGTGVQNLTDTSLEPERQPNWEAVPSPQPPRPYVHPRGATPLRLSLVPAFRACNTASATRTHGAPLSYPSCRPPFPTSGNLTIGTPEVNGAGARSSGAVLIHVLEGDPSTDADEADVSVAALVTDVRQRSDGTDYTGSLGIEISLRITDANGTSPYTTSPTGTGDTSLAFHVPCFATADNAIGGTCELSTTIDTLVPGIVPEGKRSLWEVGQVHAFDGGPDGDAATDPNTVFMEQGIFIP